MSSTSDPTPTYDVVVIGAGFAGIYLVHKLRDELGLDVKVFERGAGIERQFDPALLVVAQHRRIQPAGGQAHPAQVGDRADQGQRHRTPGQQPEQGLGPAEQDRLDDAGQQDRDRPGEQDAQDEEKAGGHVDIHGLGCRGA